MDTKRKLQIIGNLKVHVEVLKEQDLRDPVVQKALADLFGESTGGLVELNAKVEKSLLVNKNDGHGG